MFDNLKTILSQSGSENEEPSVLGVDISPSSIKIVQLRRRKGQAVLETYGEIALGPYAGFEIGQATNLPPEKIAEALLDVIREAKVTTKDCGLSIPFTSSLISILEVPTIDEEKLKAIIPIEARKYIPVPISEVYLDWHLIPNDPVDQKMGIPRQQKSEVMIVAIHKETISRYQSIVEKSNLKTSFFEIEIFSTVRAVLDRGIAPVMIIDLGYSSTKLYIVEHGVVRRSHNVNRGIKDISQALAASLNISFAEAEKLRKEVNLKRTQSEDDHIASIASVGLNYIFSEAERALADYQKRQTKAISELVFAGAGALLPGLAELAKTRFGIETTIADPFKKIETPAFLENVLKEVGPEFAVAIGLALRRLEEIE